jgi:L-asparagine transporter-like permease
MVAGEAIYPRKTIKTAFKTMYFRFGLFFIMGALCVGIILPSDDPTLNALLDGGDTGTGASSPYVIAMKNMGISVLPDLTNALMVTSIFSAGTLFESASIVNRHANHPQATHTSIAQPAHSILSPWMATLHDFFGAPREPAFPFTASASPWFSRCSPSSPLAALPLKGSNGSPTLPRQPS